VKRGQYGEFRRTRLAPISWATGSPGENPSSRTLIFDPYQKFTNAHRRIDDGARDIAGRSWQGT